MNKEILTKLGIEPEKFEAAVKEFNLTVLTADEKTEYEKRLAEKYNSEFENTVYSELSKELEIEKADRNSIKAKISELKKQPIIKTDAEIEAREKAILDLQNMLKEKENEFENYKVSMTLNAFNNEKKSVINAVPFSFSEEELAIGEDFIKKAKAERAEIIDTMVSQKYEFKPTKNGIKIFDKATGKEAVDSVHKPLSLNDVIALTIENSNVLKSFVQPKQKAAGRGEGDNKGSNSKFANIKELIAYAEKNNIETMSPEFDKLRQEYKL